MNQQFRHRPLSAGNPIANVLVIIAGVLVISLSLALGFLVFVGIAGFVLVAAVAMSIRGWWQRRRFGAKAAANPDGHVRKTQQRHIIEGEFHELGGHEENEHTR